MKRRSVTTRALFTLLILAQICVALTGETRAASATSTPATESKASQKASRKASQKAPTQYTCLMHPEVKSKSRGKCPKCGMALRPVRADVAATAAATSEAKTKETGAITSLRIPDTVVYDQNNRKLRFYTDLVKGRTVAINFIFTTCTTICPPLAATFRKVQQELGARAGDDIQMISISVDPTTDTPERLKSFSSKFGAGPGWTFVTGSKPEVDALLSALGAAVPDKVNHSPMVLVGNEAAGYWTRTYGLAPASTLVKLITEASAKSATLREETMKTKSAAAATTAPASAPVMQSSTVGSVAPTTAATSTADGRAKSVAEAAATYFPNVELLTQDGQPVRFYEDLLKDKIVLINFMFTTCTSICPPMTGNMAKVQRYLGEHVGREVLMISISVDPQVDTPPVLKKYAENFKAQPGWYFLTGRKENVERVLAKLGGFVADKTEHSVVLIIGNEATGDWMKVHAMSKPAEIAAAVTRMVESQAKARATASQSSR